MGSEVGGWVGGPTVATGDDDPPLDGQCLHDASWPEKPTQRPMPHVPLPPPHGMVGALVAVALDTR